MKCYVLMRNDTGAFYCGSYRRDFHKRWSKNMEKAKKYKRKCDVSNVITTMKKYFLKEMGNKKFTIYVCELVYVDEYQI